MDANPGREYVLTLSCPDKPGIVYAVSSFLVQHSGNILASQQYGESPDGRFFMRVHFTLPPVQTLAGPQEAPLAPQLRLAQLERDFSWVAEAFQMSLSSWINVYPGSSSSSRTGRSTVGSPGHAHTSRGRCAWRTAVRWRSGRRRARSSPAT